MATAMQGRPVVKGVADDRFLTDRQKQFMDLLFSRALRGEVTPSVREFGEEFGISSPNGVMCHLRALKRKGWIDWTPDASRSIRLLRTPDGRLLRGFAPLAMGEEKCPCCNGAGVVATD